MTTATRHNRITRDGTRNCTTATSSFSFTIVFEQMFIRVSMKNWALHQHPTASFDLVGQFTSWMINARSLPRVNCNQGSLQVVWLMKFDYFIIIIIIIQTTSTRPTNSLHSNLSCSLLLLLHEMIARRKSWSRPRNIIVEMFVFWTEMAGRKLWWWNVQDCDWGSLWHRCVYARLLCEGFSSCQYCFVFHTCMLWNIMYPIMGTWRLPVCGDVRTADVGPSA